MKKILRTFTLIGLLLLSARAVAQDPNFYIFLCLGQSNMEGFPGIPDEDKGPVDPRFQVLAAVDFPALKREKDHWYPAVPPLSRPSAGLSPADFFGRALVAKLPPHIKVGVVNVAVGGCKIALFEKEICQSYVAEAPEWMKPALAAYDGNPYQRLVEMGKLAQKSGVIKGILLHQGESNSGEADWPAKVKGVYENLLRELNLNADEVPLIAGEVVSADQNGKCAGMNPIIATLPAFIPTAHVVPSAGCAGLPDRLHFTPEGYRELGRRYAETLLPFLNRRNAAPEILEYSSPGSLKLIEPTTASVRPSVWVDTLDLKTAIQDYGTATSKTSLDGHPLTIAGRTFERGFATHAEGWLAIRLDGKGRTFSAQVGIDDEVKGKPGGTAEFVVLGDEVKLWSSGLMRLDDAAKTCEVPLAGVKRLELVVTDGEDNNFYDHADWAEAKIETDGTTTFETIARTSGEPYILTPPTPATPRINGASVFGVRPGSPFLFTVPATGDRPMKFSATELPAGLELDPKTGRITGLLAASGTFVVTLRAENALGRTEKKFRIVCGDRIALTPPMGWNSWNCFAQEVTADRVKRAADTLTKTGLINHGWTYINVDDFWQNHRGSKDPTLTGPARDAQGNIQPNVRFGDMKALADYVHGLGLKIGLYSSPGPWTCGGCAGSYGHELQDAQAYAAWGFDYLKYDWCSYGGLTQGIAATDPKLPSVEWGRGTSDLAIAQAPYALMGEALHRQPRDIVYSLCQYGMSDVWKWGDTVGGNSWRTTNDISGTWKSMSGIVLAQDKAAPFAQPGNWNDPDMLILGHIGWGNPQPTRLTPDEQYLHFSLWCLFSAPLLIGCDMEKLDAFTLNLLTNDEVIALNQDPLGHQATCVDTVGDVRVYLKKLEDGSVAIGFCNFGRQPAELKYANFAPLGLAGQQRVRDLWRQQNVGTIEVGRDAWPLAIPTHGIVLLKLTPMPVPAS